MCETAKKPASQKSMTLVLMTNSFRDSMGEDTEFQDLTYTLQHLWPKPFFGFYVLCIGWVRLLSHLLVLHLSVATVQQPELPRLELCRRTWHEGFKRIFSTSAINMKSETKTSSYVFAMHRETTYRTGILNLFIIYVI